MFLEKAKCKSFWEGVRTRPEYGFMINEILTEYERVALGEIKDISYDAFMHYHRTGERTVFEREYYMPRRQRLTVCALLSLIYPDEGEYFSNLMNTIWAICNEYCWALPNHTRNSEKVYNDSYIDLFAADTGYALSEIRVLLEDRLDVLIKERIRKELDKRIIQPFLEQSFRWERYRTNWAAVCAGSVGCVFMYEHPELFYQVKPRLDAAMESFLSSYKKDGVCREGMLYWQYGFGFFTSYAQHLLEFSEGKYNYFADKHVKRIAHFPEVAFLGKGNVVSFSDCGRTARVGLGTMAVLDLHYGDVLSSVPAEYYMIMDENKRGRWHLAVRSFVFFDPDRDYRASIRQGEFYMEASQWFIKKCKAYEFAAKGGHNDEPHNHNDVGSFLFSCNGEQILADLGNGEYTKEYFEDRYRILGNRSGGHSVPIPDGQEQCAGAEYAGRMNYIEGKLIIDITAAYPKTRVTKIIREFTFTQNSVLLRDCYTFGESCEVKERLITLIKPVILEGRIKLKQAAILFDSAAWNAVVTEQVRRRYDSSEETVYLIDFQRTNEQVTEFGAEITAEDKEEFK